MYTYVGLYGVYVSGVRIAIHGLTMCGITPEIGVERLQCSIQKENQIDSWSEMLTDTLIV